MPTLDHALISLESRGEKSSKGYQLFAVQLSFLLVAWLFVLLRGYVRIFLLEKTRLDDYLLFSAIVSFLPSSRVSIRQQP